MKRLVLVLVLALAVPVLAKTHRDYFDVSCGALWPALKDTLRNSGKYGIIGIDNSEMTASYNMGGNLVKKRVNSVVLNSKGSGCEMQVQTAFSGIENNDAGDLKKRVQQSLEKLKTKPEDDAEAAQILGQPEKIAEAKKNCHLLFQATVDRKIADLTVREEQNVRACQSLGYYE